MKANWLIALFGKFWLRVLARTFFGAAEGVLWNLISWKLTASGQTDFTQLFHTKLTLVCAIIVVLHIAFEIFVERQFGASNGTEYSSSIMQAIQPDLVQRFREQIQGGDDIKAVMDGICQTQKPFKIPPSQKNGA